MRFLTLPMLAVVLASCALTTGNNPVLTEASLQTDVQAAVAAANLSLQSNPTRLAQFRSACHVAGQLILSFVNSASLPTSQDLHNILASKLSGAEVGIIANVQSIVAAAYSSIYAKFSGNVTMAAPWLTAIGTPLSQA